MDLTAAGNAILFVCCLVATSVVTLYVLAYAAYCFLTVLQDTTAGLDKVVWPNEMFYDWLGRAIPIWGIFLLWLTPAGMLARGLRHVLWPDDPGLRFLVLAIPGLWLFLPVGLLSALSGEVGWIPVRLTVLRQLARLFPSVLVFYLATALLMTAAVVPWYYAVFTDRSHLLLIAAAAFATLVLIYARLLGRIGWLIDRLHSVKRKRTQADMPQKEGAQTLDLWTFPKDEAEEPRPKKKKKKREAAAVEPEPPVEIYEVLDDEPVQIAAVEGFDDHDPVAEERPPVPQPRPALDSTPLADRSAERVSRIEQELLERPAPPPAPTYPLFTGVYTFPWYLSTLKVWTWLTLGGLAIGLGMRATLHYWPW